jgi:[ribosomal protein S5]-alanine N-acetyltransferase
MPTFPTLQTQRLILREVVEADADALLAIHRDAKHMQWFGTDPPTDLEAAKAVVKMFAGLREQTNPGVRWAIEMNGQPGLIGTCGLFRWDKAWKRCMTGYELSREHAGQGLMREALSEVFAWGWEHMQLNRIEAQVHPQNAPSLALVQRLGFVEEGRLREIGFWGGRHHDLIQYSLLKAEWVSDAPPHSMLRANQP